MPLKIKSIVHTLRGENPLHGIPSLVCDIIDTGKLYTDKKFIKLLDAGVGEVITLIGKPFRQLSAVSNFVSTYSDRNHIIIETSGRIGELDNDRQIIVPIINQSILVIKPDINNFHPIWYSWMSKYRFESIYYKFCWTGNDKELINFITQFFKVIDKNILSLIKSGQILIMPDNISNIQQCRDAWDFCRKYELCYSGREFVRLFK